MSDFCIACGIPKEIVEDWDLGQLASFIKQLSSESEKKSSPETI